MENWIAKAVGTMHKNRITQIDIAKKMGVTNDYISMILLGKKNPKEAKNRINTAIDEIIAEREKENQTNPQTPDLL